MFLDWTFLERDQRMSFGWGGIVCFLPTIVDYARLLVPMVEVVLQIKHEVIKGFSEKNCFN